MRTWLCVLLMLSAATSIGRTAVVYAHAPTSNGVLYKSAWYPPDGLNGDSYTYDSFSLQAATPITEVRWNGGYANWQIAGGSSPVYDFEVSFYGHVQSANQPDVSHPPLAKYMTGSNASETPTATIAGVPAYDYSFSLPSPFQAAAGQTYWLRIVASQHLTPSYWPPDWGLFAASGGNNSHFLGYNAEGYHYSFRSDDLTFSLLTSDGPVVTVNAASDPPDAGPIGGAGVYPVGSLCSLTATPAPGYGFVSWTENGVQVSTQPSYTFTASVSRTLVAHFTPAFTINASALPQFGGSVSGGGVFNSGAPVQVKATPAPGFRFVKWTWFGSELSASATYDFIAEADLDLVANFEPDPMTAVFDFDNGYPELGLGAALPFAQASGLITADFSSPGGSNWFITSDAQMFWTLSQFQGNYLNQSNVFRQSLDIRFGQMMTAVSLTFATGDLHQQENPTSLRLTAYSGSVSGAPVGLATAAGVYQGDTFPMGTLGFSSSSPFDLVRIEIPYQPTGATTFLVDNVTATLAPLGVVSLSDAAGYPDGTKVRLTAPMAATVPSSTFASGDIYIEEPGRASGLLVKGAAGISEGDRLLLSGTLGTDVFGERFLLVSSIDSSLPGSPLTPLLMTNKAAAEPLARAHLAQVWGRVLQVAPDGSHLMLDDGSSVDSGAGLKVLLDAITANLMPGEYLIVKGVVTASGILPRSDGDIKKQ